MSITLNQILALVGKLGDAPGTDTPRERFRGFLRENIRDISQVRDYVEDCLRYTGDQYNCALQDLINHIGHFLEFEVTFGRYKGVRGQIGFDGLWKSPQGMHLVVEVKTTEVYSIKTATLVNYVNELISEKQVPSWDNTLGLYVIGRPDPKLRQLENAIFAEKRTHQLRIISVESLLSLAEMLNEYDISHEDILSVIRPSDPSIDTIVDLMARLVAEPTDEELPEPYEAPTPSPNVVKESNANYWLTSVKTDKEATAEEVIGKLVGREHIYAFGDRTPGRKHIKPGDWICFYASGKGVVAHAQISTAPEKKVHPQVRHPDKYPWTFKLEQSNLYLDNPIIIDATLRNRLDAFRGRDPGKAWAWFVQATRKITAHDFSILHRHAQDQK